MGYFSDPKAKDFGKPDPTFPKFDVAQARRWLVSELKGSCRPGRTQQAA